MIHLLFFSSLLLAQAGRSAQQEQDCSKVVDCYGKLGKQFWAEMGKLPGQDLTNENNGPYNRFCSIVFASKSPCSWSNDYKECSQQPAIEQREKIYKQVRGFLCDENETSWKRFAAIKSAGSSDPCKGFLEAVEQVLKNQMDKCGTAKQQLRLCATKYELKADQLEAGMDLLGCQQQPEAKPVPAVPAVPALPVNDPPEEKQCNKGDAWNCLIEEGREMVASFGFQHSDTIKKQPACTGPVEECLAKHKLEGCSQQESMIFSPVQEAIKEVRKVACDNDKALLKEIEGVASSYDLTSFEECLKKSNARLDSSALSPDQCRAVLAETNKCIDTSCKSCDQSKGASVVKKLPPIFFTFFGCAVEESGDGGVPVDPPKKPAKDGTKSSGVWLASSLTLALSAAFIAGVAS